MKIKIFNREICVCALPAANLSCAESSAEMGERMELRQMLENMKKSCIRIIIDGEAEQKTGASKFGGMPDVPVGFDWPIYCGTSMQDQVTKERPLSFLAQFNCEELSQYDETGLLPKTGLLSFFYEEATAEWGYDPGHKGCSRVFYFKDIDTLKRISFPEDLEEDYKNLEIGIAMKKEISYPDTQDINLKYAMTQEQYDEYDEILETQEQEFCVHQFLGWPGIIQNNMTMQCELIEKGYYLGGVWKEIPSDEIENARQHSLEKWQLLLQLDEVEQGDFYLSFGDCGRLYFYIRTEDLKKGNFENVWLNYQCF